MSVCPPLSNKRAIRVRASSTTILYVHQYGGCYGDGGVKMSSLFSMWAIRRRAGRSAMQLARHYARLVHNQGGGGGRTEENGDEQAGRQETNYCV